MGVIYVLKRVFRDTKQRLYKNNSYICRHIIAHQNAMDIKL
mgnify:CR=1 FL=1